MITWLIRRILKPIQFLTRKMSEEFKPRPRKREEDFGDHYARLQALLMSRGAGSRDIDGRPRLDHAHPDVERCAGWMERATGLNTSPESQYSSLSKKARIERWQALKRNLPPDRMSQLTSKLERHYGYQSYSAPDTSTLQPSPDLSEQVDLQDAIDLYKKQRRSV